MRSSKKPSSVRQGLPLAKDGPQPLTRHRESHSPTASRAQLDLPSLSDMSDFKTAIGPLRPPALTETRLGVTNATADGRCCAYTLRQGFCRAHRLIVLSLLSGESLLLPTSRQRIGRGRGTPAVCSRGIQTVSLTGVQDVCSQGLR